VIVNDFNLFVFPNRLIGGTGERYDWHDMENNRHLVSRSDCLQSRQVLTGNVHYINIINFTTDRHIVFIRWTDVWSLIYIILQYLYYILYIIYYIVVVGDLNAPRRASALISYNNMYYFYIIYLTYSMAINNNAYTIDSNNKLLTIIT